MDVLCTSPIFVDTSKECFKLNVGFLFVQNHVTGVVWQGSELHRDSITDAEANWVCPWGDALSAKLSSSISNKGDASFNGCSTNHDRKVNILPVLHLIGLWEGIAFRLAFMVPDGWFTHDIIRAICLLGFIYKHKTDNTKQRLKISSKRLSRNCHSGSTEETCIGRNGGFNDTSLTSHH